MVDLREGPHDLKPFELLRENDLIGFRVEKLGLEFFRVDQLGDIVLHLLVEDDLFDGGALGWIDREHAVEEVGEGGGELSFG